MKQPIVQRALQAAEEFGKQRNKAIWNTYIATTGSVYVTYEGGLFVRFANHPPQQSIERCLEVQI